MKTLILMLALCACTTAGTQKNEPAKLNEEMLKHVSMHESMAKAHQQAADCLKSGKPMEECRGEFMGACESAGGPGMCGMGEHKKGHMKRK